MERDRVGDSMQDHLSSESFAKATHEIAQWNTIDSSLDDWAFREEARKQLQTEFANRGLIPRQTDVIVLREIDGMTQEETAARLGMPRGTVKTHDARPGKSLGWCSPRRNLFPS